MRPSVPRVLAFATLLVATSACASAPSTMPATPSVPATSSPSAAFTPGPSAAVTGSTPPSVPAVAWSRVALGPGASVFGLATLSGSLVAVGQVDAHAAAWTSSDGTTWRSSDVKGDGNHLSKAVPFRSGLIASGCATRSWPACLSKKAASGAWTSTDGRTWTAHVLPMDLPYAYVSDIAATANAVVVVGMGTDCPPSVGEVGLLVVARLVDCGNHAEAWWSTDGTSWHLVRVTACDGGLTSVAVTAGGSFVALPSYVPGPACGSADGQHWHALAGTVAFMAGNGALASTGSGLLAAAIDGIWSSADGSAWSHETVPSLEGAALGGLATSGGRIVAFGQRGSVGAVWISGDGESWAAVPGDPTFSATIIQSAAVGGGRLVVAGGPSSFSGQDPGGSIWVADVTGLP